jgi:uncharacterized protein (DUF1501 family)
MSTEERAVSHFSRRHFLAQQAFGLGGLALAWLLKEDQAFALPAKPNLDRATYDLMPRVAAHPPQARAMISMFMQGGPSHVDLFDPKPELTKHHLQRYAGDIKYDDAAGASSKLFGSPWKFHHRGQCGMQLSELLPALGDVADDICLIRSMHSGVNNHVQAIDALNTGQVTAGRPSLGSWLTYGLGNPSQNLPAFLVLTDPSGLPVGGVSNGQNGWLPSLYQGTVVRPTEPRILNLDAPPGLRGRAQTEFLSYLNRINAEHRDRHPRENDLDARIKSYELGARMQVAAKEALDTSRESRAVHRLYGLDDPITREYGTRCLIARRMVERGVRFVQIFTGNQTWDHHNGIVASLPRICRRTDKPAAALVKDLKSIGLLDTTLVHWGGEMGRLPVIENEKNIGRDHNTYGFSMWLAGGGVKSGCVYGETDEIGHKAAKNIVNHYDYHATLLHLFGLDEKQVTFTRPVGRGSLIDGQPARVVLDILERGPQSRVA